jgi:hypothetical protein
MYELLLRTETLFWGLSPLVLLLVGVVALGAGLVLWLGGTRHSAVIIGLLGAVVGSAGGLLVSQWLNLNPWLSMIVGAAVLGGVSILLRNILILVLAVLVFSALSGGGYLAVVLDRAVPQNKSQTPVGQDDAFRSFTAMDPAGRLAYVDDLSNKSRTFEERLAALLANTWEAIRPHFVMVALTTLAGAVIGIVLVWFVAKIVIALAYSIVGTASILVGAQAGLLAAKYPAASALADYRGALPIAFLVMIAIGWLWQLFSSHRRMPKREPHAQEETPRAQHGPRAGS